MEKEITVRWINFDNEFPARMVLDKERKMIVVERHVGWFSGHSWEIPVEDLKDMLEAMSELVA